MRVGASCGTVAAAKPGPALAQIPEPAGARVSVLLVYGAPSPYIHSIIPKNRPFLVRYAVGVPGGAKSAKPAKAVGFDR